jgi:signal transduction histidine kinase
MGFLTGRGRDIRLGSALLSVADLLPPAPLALAFPSKSGRRRVELDVQLGAETPLLRARVLARSSLARYALAVLALAVAYYGAAKLAQSLRYTGSVSAIWPPAGLGIAALYLWGLRLWPGIFIGELIVNALLFTADNPLPFWSLVGQQIGNMLEVVVGAVLLRRLVGRRAGLDRPVEIVGMLVALGTATTISAVAGTLSMLGTGVIESEEADLFFRTWWLGDTAGGLVALPLILIWARDPRACWRRVRTAEGLLLLMTVTALSLVAFSGDEPLTYVVFPGLVWAALRFGPPGASLAILVAAGAAIGFTAHELGPFSSQTIDHRALSTQLYIGIAALTTLFVGALVEERDRSDFELSEVMRTEGERALEERHRIARELHDSVSQALFSTLLHTRTAQRELENTGEASLRAVEGELTAIAELTAGAQREMRGLLRELNRTVEPEKLVAGLTRHASTLGNPDGLTFSVSGPESGLGLSPGAETEFLAIGREALSNVVRHSHAHNAWVRVDAQNGRVSLEIRDDGKGFDAAGPNPGHYGLESMRSRAEEIGAVLTIVSRRGEGTCVRVETAAEGTNGA